MNITLRLVVLAVTLLSVGCASVPMAPPEADAQAKMFQTTPGKANLYIYRNETMGAAIKMPVLINNQHAGDTAAHTYIYKAVTPGAYVIVSKTENDATLTVDAEADKNYYIWQEVKMGAFSARSALHLVDETKGKAGVQQTKLVK